MFSSVSDQTLVDCLRRGGVAVIPTDTLYGIVARAADRRAVQRVYHIRGRAPEKPCIVLVADRRQITDNSLWTDDLRRLADTYWPGPLSLVAPTATTPQYLHRGTHTLAYRVPSDAGLRELLAATGPLIAPSANPEGKVPAATVAEAIAYFGDAVDGYADGGRLTATQPSTVATVRDGRVHIFRQGALRISQK